MPDNKTAECRCRASAAAMARTPGTTRGAQLFENMVHNAATPANSAMRAMPRRAYGRSARADARSAAPSMAPIPGCYPGHSAPASLKRRRLWHARHGGHRYPGHAAPAFIKPVARSLGDSAKDTRTHQNSYSIIPRADRGGLSESSPAATPSSQCTRRPAPSRSVPSSAGPSARSFSAANSSSAGSRRGE